MIDVLLVEDDIQVAKSIKDFLQRKFSVHIALTAEEALEVLQEKNFSVVLCDLKLPGMSGLELLQKMRNLGISTPFIMITAFGDIPTAVAATKLGASDFVRKGDITPEELIRKIESLIDESDWEFVFGSETMRNLLKVARQVAKTDSTVLILGESGVGKEMLAKYIHKASPRAGRPFVAVNMSAIPDTLLEAELFGYEKGAFTGAERRKPGKFELADGGTLLLDEIGDMPLHLQPKILRVIQEKQVERLGQYSQNPIKIDVRIICTTNKDIEKLVKEGKFREDLFYRISVIPIRIPPLRERRDDIIPLTRYFLKKLSKKYEVNISMSEKAYEKLLKYDWPGNVRELQNVVERAFILSWTGGKESFITPESIVFSSYEIQNINLNKTDGKEISEGKEVINYEKKNIYSLSGFQMPITDDLNIKNMEKVFILKALEKTGGNKTRAAKLLGITVRTLRNKLKELKLEESEKSKEDEEE